VVRFRVSEPDAEPAEATPRAIARSTPLSAEAYQGFLYGRIATGDGVTYEGRLRWGGNQEAFWDDYFNGARDENPWGAHVPPASPPGESRSFEIFGFRIGGRDRQNNLDRQFMARFGDIARITATFSKVQVTLKSGTVSTLDRFAAGDMDDGVRVWDGKRGALDLDAREIRTIELRPTAPAAVPDRLHGTVRTRQGDFTGFIQWDRHDCVGTDELEGRTAEAEVHLRYDTIRSIARRSRISALVTLVDGREVVLADTREVGNGHRGIYIDDRRYGRVLISWDAFERLDFSAGGSGPAYPDFRPGRPLMGSVTTHHGRRLAGRLVYDLDESETTETFDAPAGGVEYYIPFGLITSIVQERNMPRARVILHSGEELALERSGDLGEAHAGVLLFIDGRPSPQHVMWADVERIDFDRSHGDRPETVVSPPAARPQSVSRHEATRTSAAAPLP
jgi:hypothetical protein